MSEQLSRRGGRLPQFHAAIRRRRKQLTAGVEEQARHGSGMRTDEGGLLTIALIPKADRLIIAGRGKHLTVGANSDRIDSGSMARELAFRLLEIAHIPGAD